MKYPVRPVGPLSLAALFVCVRPYITVFAQRGQVDFAYAAPFLTHALGFTPPASTTSR